MGETSGIMSEDFAGRVIVVSEWRGKWIGSGFKDVDGKIKLSSGAR